MNDSLPIDVEGEKITIDKQTAVTKFKKVRLPESTRHYKDTQNTKIMNLFVVLCLNGYLVPSRWKKYH